MRNFEFENRTKIVFGKGCENELLFELRKYGDKVMYVYGGSTIKKSGLYETIAMQLREANKAVCELGGVQPNPRLSLVRKGIEIARRNKVDLILAVGGGSVIDTAKAIAIGAVNDGDVWNYYENGIAPHRAVPVGVVLTNAASGSEGSDSTVITNDDIGVKRGLNAACVVPKFAFLNPERTFTLSRYQTACGCVDILAHLFERYFSPDKNNDITTNLLIGAMKTIIKNAPIAYENPKDYNARAEIMYTGTVAHNGSLSVGRRGDWASHKIEHALSALNDMAHGEGLAIVFPAWMKYVYEQEPSAFALLATDVFGIEKGDKSDEQLTYEFITALEAFYKSLGMRTKLSEVGFSESDVGRLAELTMYRYDSIGGFMKLYKSDVENILRLAF